MKSVHKLIVMLFIFGCTAIVPAVVQEPTKNGKTDLTITGTVRDRETRKKLENVTVTLAGTSIGTVTNAEGVFSLKIPAAQSDPQLELSHVGSQDCCRTSEETGRIAFSSTGGKFPHYVSPAGRRENEDYWTDYNIIEPTESLENAVKKLRKQL